jgi:hypothetical protein
MLGEAAAGFGESSGPGHPASPNKSAATPIAPHKATILFFILISSLEQNTTAAKAAADEVSVLMNNHTTE